MPQINQIHTDKNREYSISEYGIKTWNKITILSAMNTAH